MEWKRRNYLISNDKKRLDIDYIHQSLNTTYWAETRTRQTVKQSVKNSIWFGVYTKGRQTGFARAVTDKCTFSWIADVFIDPEYRGRGLGLWLMQCVTSHPVISKTMMLLGTRDAHKLYEKVKFERKGMMRRVP